ncbi:MAG: hypothetical protein JKX94_09245 [Sneathiella sp.]|nr:hypothetical protein [Sneathiella sp.]
MQNLKVMRAIQNNSEWCLRIWQSHGLPTNKTSKIWSCPANVPDFYPNAITMQPVDAQTIQPITDLQVQEEIQNFSLKDSFGDLSKFEVDLRCLFEAHWLYRSKEINLTGESHLDWRLVQSEAELRHWEEKWDTRQNKGATIFYPDLLTDPLVGFWTGSRDDDVKAGYISNETGPVVGISNIFGRYEDCVTHAALQFSDLDIVGYETADTIMEAKTLGFDVVGDLAIWIAN